MAEPEVEVPEVAVPVVMKMLFETPSGFAMFGLDGGYLNDRNAAEILWTHFVSKTTAKMIVKPLEFQKFENKSDAINPISGISRRLAKMIKKWWRFEQALVVGKPEHKYIIEEELNIPCRYDQAVLEVMWGVKNFLHTLVPEEELELSDEDSKHRSQGLQMFLQKHKFDIERELVNGQMAEAACFVYHCIETDKQLLKCMRRTHVVEDEGIDTQGWDALKYAAALSLMCTNESLIGPDQVFTKEEITKILGGKGKRKDIKRENFMMVYKTAVEAHTIKVEKLLELDGLVKEAKERAREDAQLQAVPEELESLTKKRKIETEGV
ncbi:unnamed protein product [Urochloa decumbens]|uniref:Uncharacterized protein n=1 Tax=Urochloa decumbens TaxID=240449 RepID=A0ABC8WJ16_9POAL